MIKKRLGILTGGGDVPPLNTVIASVLEKSLENNFELFGFLNGWQGVLEQNCINLSGLKMNPQIGGTILKSSRVNLGNVEGAEKKVTESLSKFNIDGLIVIGGDDTLSNSFLLMDIPQVLISKTIDNDVGVINRDKIVNYFTLGFPTAAEKISSFVSLDEGLRTTAYSHERIIIVESMGMHAGWLAIASSFGHPDFIIIPEYPLDYENLLEKVIDKYRKQKHIILVVAEGSKWLNGNYISANENNKDRFGHPKFSGAAEVLSGRMKSDLKKYFDTRDINSVNPSYLYRSGKPNETDTSAAISLGTKAVDIFSNNLTEPVFLSLNYINSKFEVDELFLKEINNIEEFHRFVDVDHYNPSEFFVTCEGKEYLSKIIFEHPKLEYDYH